MGHSQSLPHSPEVVAVLSPLGLGVTRELGVAEADVEGNTPKTLASVYPLLSKR